MAGTRPNGSGSGSKPARGTTRASSIRGSDRGGTYASRSGYDRERLVGEVAAITAHYSGSEPERQGRRLRFRCPECGKDLLDANTDTSVTGCWNQDCPVPESDTAIGLISYFEGLDPSVEFMEVLRRGYELAGLPPEPSAPQQEKQTAAGSPPGAGATPAAGDTGDKAGGTARGGARGGAHEPTEHQLDLADRVYRYVLSVCPLEKSHYDFWARRGLTPETIAKAGLGSISETRWSYLLRRIKKQFSEADLLSVPGFFYNDGGKLSFTFRGEFTLIPYHDRRGRISTIEARVLEETPPTGGKYRSLRGSHNHLYLFPGTDPNDLAAFCEGPIGAIAAAQEGVAVGAIQGYRRYKGLPGPDGEERPPPEIQGADFGGRKVAFIPDVDHPPQPHVLAEVPETARVLVALQNGEPTTVTLPQGSDLDEYLFALGKGRRHSSLVKLLENAGPATPSSPEAHDDSEEARTTDPEAIPAEGTPQPIEGADSGGEPGNGGAEKGPGGGKTEPGGERDPSKEKADPEEGRSPQTAQGEPTQTGKVIAGPWPDRRPPEDETASRGAPAGRPAGNGRRAAEDATTTHQARRPKPTIGNEDPWAWTRRDPDRHRQPLPSDQRLSRPEAVDGLKAFAVVWAVLLTLVALAYLLAGYVTGAGLWTLPGPLAVLLATALTLAVAAAAGVTVALREGSNRRARRRMLEGRIRW